MTSDYDGPPPTRPPSYPPAFPASFPASDPLRSPPPYQPFPGPPPPTPLPARSRRSAWVVTGVVVVLAIGLSILSGLLGARSAHDTPIDDGSLQPLGCGYEAAPAGASDAAIAYLLAVNRENATQVGISDQITRTGRVSSIDMTEQILSDRSFANDVRAIRFDPAVTPAVTMLLDAITAYDNFLNLAASSGSYYTSHQDEDAQLQAARSDAAAQVRVALDLPASSCQLNRP